MNSLSNVSWSVGDFFPQRWAGGLRLPAHRCGIHYGGWKGGNYIENISKYIWYSPYWVPSAIQLAESAALLQYVYATLDLFIKI